MGYLKIRCPETGHDIGCEHIWLKCDSRFVEDETAGSVKQVC